MNLRKDHYHTDPTDRTLRTVPVGPRLSAPSYIHTPFEEPTSYLKPVRCGVEAATLLLRRRGLRRVVYLTYQCDTTFSNGYLGSRNDEERSEMRYVMRIAELSESSNL